MSQMTFSETERRIIDFLRKANEPNQPSLIAANISETKRETRAALLELERKGILYREPDFTLLIFTGEREAFGLKQLG
jgi:hypothetical protein